MVDFLLFKRQTVKDLGKSSFERNSRVRYLHFLQPKRAHQTGMLAHLSCPICLHLTFAAAPQCIHSYIRSQAYPAPLGLVALSRRQRHWIDWQRGVVDKSWDNKLRTKNKLSRDRRAPMEDARRSFHADLRPRKRELPKDIQVRQNIESLPSPGRVYNTRRVNDVS